MLLTIITILILIIGLLILITGIIQKKKILKICSLILIFISIILSILNYVFYTKNSKNNIDNINVSNNTNLNNTVYDNVENATFLHGQILKVEDNKIYIINNDNKNYVLYNNNQQHFFDGRTDKSYSFEELKEGYYIEKILEGDAYKIFKNITGEELKKELLISLSLPDSANIMRTSVDEIKDVEQLGNNEAIVTFTISDIVSSDYFSNVNDEEHSFDVKLKVTNDTKYNTRFHGNSAYNAETIENAKSEAMLYLRLNPNTLNKEYPEISEFDAYSN